MGFLCTPKGAVVTGVSTSLWDTPDETRRISLRRAVNLCSITINKTKVKTKMGEMLVNDKEVVVPGQVIAKGLDFLPSQGTYRLNESIIANRVGVLSVEGKVLKTIPLSGRYLPQRNDIIIGKVDDILMSGWRFDINSPYSAVLPLKDASFDFIAKGADLSKIFALDDYALLKITNVTSQNLIDVTARGGGLRKLKGGMILRVNPQKVPRIIGKKGMMTSLIRRATGCKIVVGQNGLIWIDGEPEMEVIAIAAINKVENESHLEGTTESVRKFLEEKTGKPVSEEMEPQDTEVGGGSSDFQEGNSDFERPEGSDDETGNDAGAGRGGRGRGGFGGERRGGFGGRGRGGRGGGRPPFRHSGPRSY
jgi:exosome complex component RRP4